MHSHVLLRRPFRLWRQSVRSWVETNNKTQHCIHVDIIGITFNFFQGSLSVKKTRKVKIWEEIDRNLPRLRHAGKLKGKLIFVANHYTITAGRISPPSGIVHTFHDPQMISSLR